MKCKSDADVYIAKDKRYSKSSIIYKAIGKGLLITGTVALGIAIPPLISLAASSAGGTAGTAGVIGGVAKGVVIGTKVAKGVAIGASIGSGVAYTGGAVSYLVSKSFP